MRLVTIDNQLRERSTAGESLKKGVDRIRVAVNIAQMLEPAPNVLI
jgi:hypothetical protein